MKIDMKVEIPHRKDRFKASERPEQNFKQQYSGIAFHEGQFIEFVNIRLYQKGVYWYCCIWMGNLCASARSRHLDGAVQAALTNIGVETFCDDGVKLWVSGNHYGNVELVNAIARFYNYENFTVVNEAG